MDSKTSINMGGNSEILDAFLEHLLLQGYTFDSLIENRHDFYVISREHDNRLGLISETGWFNGDSFGSEEYWFDGIDTQEIGDDIFLEIGDENTRRIYKLEDGKIKLEKGNQIRMDIGDLVALALAKNTGNMN